MRIRVYGMKMRLKGGIGRLQKHHFTIKWLPKNKKLRLLLTIWHPILKQHTERSKTQQIWIWTKRVLLSKNLLKMTESPRHGIAKFQRHNKLVESGWVTKHKWKQIKWQDQRFIYATNVIKMWHCCVLASTVWSVSKRIVEKVDHMWWWFLLFWIILSINVANQHTLLIANKVKDYNIQQQISPEMQSHHNRVVN